MRAFKEYSKYYDLIYKDKDYPSEAQYIHRLIQEYSPGAKSILNLGCGTGHHDCLLAQAGYEVIGIDLSDEMIDLAKENIKKHKFEHVPFFLQGDIRTIRLSRHYDVVTSLFHVMSYQVSNKDLESSFLTAYKHLKPNGIFIFDCWYGPGVLTDRPCIREKYLENESLLIQRRSTPIMHPNENCVEVIYDLVIKDKLSSTAHNVSEIHMMRYFFLPELLYFLDKVGFMFSLAHEWMADNKLDFTTWNLVVICKIKE